MRMIQRDSDDHRCRAEGGIEEGVAATESRSALARRGRQCAAEDERDGKRRAAPRFGQGRERARQHPGGCGRHHQDGERERRADQPGASRYAPHHPPFEPRAEQCSAPPDAERDHGLQQPQSRAVDDPEPGSEQQTQQQEGDTRRDEIVEQGGMPERRTREARQTNAGDEDERQR